MTTYNTGNPLGSVDVRDLYDNAQNADNFNNGPLDAYPDRFGVSRQSLQGIRNASQYVDLGPYGPGLIFTARNQVFSYLGEFYAPGPAILLDPDYVTTGAGAGEIANFRSVGDAILRSDLLAPTGADAVHHRAASLRALHDLAPQAASYGAIGNGIADDTAALQAAINATPNYGCLDLGGGTYKLSKGVAHAAYPTGDQPCLVVYQKTGVKIRNGKLIVGAHGLGAIDFLDSPQCSLEGTVIVGFGNFPPLDGVTGRAEKGNATEGYYHLTFDQNGNPRNNSVNTTALTTGGYGGAFPQFGGGTAATWGAWGGGYIQNIGHGVYIANSDDCLITGCDISGFNGAAVHPYNSVGVTITANHLHDNYVAGVENDSSNIRTNCSVTISGNRINNNGHPNALVTHLNLDPGYGTANNNGATPFVSVSVQNNSIVGNKRKGVDSHSVIDMVVVGNTITDTGAGINLYAGPGSKMVSALIVGNIVKRIANAKGGNTLGISAYGADGDSTAIITICGNTIEEIGVPPAIVDIGVGLSSWAIHAANANAVSITGNTAKNTTYIGQAGIVVPQSALQPVTDANITGNTINGKFVLGFSGSTIASTLSRPHITGNRFSLQSCAPYTNVPAGITAADGTAMFNSINLPDVAGAELTVGTRNTGMQVKVTVIITAGAVTFNVDANFELFGKTPITSVASTAAGVRISFAGWLPLGRNVDIVRKQSIIKQLGTNSLINELYEHDLQAAFLDVGMAIQDYAAKTSANVAANNADGVFAVYIGF